MRRRILCVVAVVSETDLMHRLQKFASRLGARLFRQNVGLAWVGKAERQTVARLIRVQPGDVLIRGARPFHAGHTGMSDLGGWRPVVITADMVGATIAQYAQAEVKENKRPTSEQLAWIDAVNKAGGCAGIVRSEADLTALINRH